MGLAPVLFIILDVACLAAVVGLLLASRPLAAAVVAALVSLVYLPDALTVVRIPIESPFWGCSISFPPPSGVLGAHVRATCVEARARWALVHLAWTSVPAVLCWFAAVAAWETSARRSTVALSLAASLASSFLLGALAQAWLTWPGEDPRWTMAYFKEWKAAGASRTEELGGICLRFLSDERTDLAGSLEEVDELRAACRRACERGTAGEPVFAPFGHLCKERGLGWPRRPDATQP